MGLKNRDGVDIRDCWKDGIRAYLGVSTAGFPNTFMVYTPFSPVALSNGTTVIEAQCDFAVAAIRKVLDSERDGARRIKSIEALPEAEDDWAAYVDAQNAPTLFPLTESWWTGANIPGKKPQMLTYLHGLGTYNKEIRGRLDQLEGFDVRYWDGGRMAKLPAAVEENGAKRKSDEISAAEHVEHTDQSATEESEAAQVLRPTATAG